MLQTLLKKFESAQSVNKPNTYSIELNRNVRLLPYTDFEDTVSLNEVYEEERQNSNIFRLMISIHPYCSNVLFNNFTEIIHYTEDGKCEMLPYGEATFGKDEVLKKGDEFKPLDYKGDNFKWNAEEAIRDTQLSNPKCGFIYQCGLNIFNNHLLRKNTFKVICKIDEKEDPEYFQKIQEFYPKLDSEDKIREKFNTIEDFMREYDGKLVMNFSDIKFDREPNLPMHQYLRENIDTFEDAVKERLIEKDGWFGFVNESSILTYIDDEEEIPEELGINLAINSYKPCDFIYMYPTPDLFSFTPLYNKYKNRIEKNWNYCLTYPSSATTDGFEDFLEMSNKRINGEDSKIAVNALKVAKFQEFTNETTFYSITYHGLKEGDLINVYYVDEENLANRILQNAEVTKLGDDEGKDKKFIFTINNGGTKISLDWAELTTEDYKNKKVTISGTTYEISNNKSCVRNGDEIIPLVNNWINCDKNRRKVCFKKVVNAVEVEYYVRIFSRIPNWKFADSAVTEYNIYDNPDTKDILLQKFQKLDNDFISINSDMAYARTIYNDNVSQIVYTDDIDLSYLHDNLGRPLHEIFLTIIKNNMGYKHWYADGGNGQIQEEIDDSNENRIEFSHAFGKVNCSFEYSYYSLYNSELKNVRRLFNASVGIDNIDFNKSSGRLGLPVLKSEKDGLNTRATETMESDEIDYYNDIHYYGDLCCYSTTNAVEESIEMVSHRFNTAQREAREDTKEYNGEDYPVGQYLSNMPDILVHDEIYTDDWDYDEFQMTDKKEFPKLVSYSTARHRKEGYFYTPHYQILLHTFNSELNSEYPNSFKLRAFDNLGGNLYKIMTIKLNYFTGGDKIVLFNQESGKFYNGKLLDSNEFLNDGVTLSENIFHCKFYDENWEEITESININQIDIKKYRILKPDPNVIPTYARLMKDGGTRYVWRDLIKNGFDDSSQIEQFPFTNGAYYVSPRINFFLKRQDPHDRIKDFTFNSETNKPLFYPFDKDGNKISVDEENNYYLSEDIKC